MTGKYNEDIEQEVYLKTWQNLSKYSEQGKFKQWICMLTANTCRDYFRSKFYKTEGGEICEDDIEDYSLQVTPEEVLDAKKRQQLILKAVDSLPKKYRQVIVLFEFEDMSQERIAEKLKIPTGTVKSRLFQARKILSQKLNYLKQGEN